MENDLCALNELKYIIFIPQFTTNDFGKSSDQAFKIQHVVQEELSLIMQNLMCMYAYTHTQYKWCTNPYYLLFYRCRLRDRLTTLATVWTSAFLETIWQVLLISRMLQFLSSLGFRHRQWILSLEFALYIYSKLRNKAFLANYYDMLFFDLN